MLQNGLRSITVSWHPPSGNGAAIIGYRLFLCHTDHDFNLGGSQTSFEVTDLLPGTSYRFAMSARNSSGWSEKSAESTDTCTASSIPFAPPPPSVEPLSCTEVRLQVLIPFANGAKVTSLLVQCKVVLPMRASTWGQDCEFPVARLRKIQVFAPAPSQQEHTRMMVTNFNRSVSSRAARQHQAQQQNETGPSLPQRTRPPGGVFFEHHARSASPKQYPPPSEWLMDVYISHLLPDTPYIFRCAAKNEHGFGQFSEPSEKVKTRRPGPPSAPAAPIVDEILPTTLLLTWKVPGNGGSIVTGYVIESVMVASGSVSQKRVQDVLYHRLQGLEPGQLYKFRIVAENRMGLSPPGVWTRPIQTPDI